jgi:hypothetical protein
MSSSSYPKFHSNPMVESFDFLNIGFKTRCPETPDTLSGYSRWCGWSIRTCTQTLRIFRILASTFLLYCFWINPNHSILYLGYWKRPCKCSYWVEMAKTSPLSSTSSGRGLPSESSSKRASPYPSPR